MIYKSIRIGSLHLVMFSMLATYAGWAGSASAQGDVDRIAAIGEVVVEQAWVQLDPKGDRTGALYLTVHNRSDELEYLMAVLSPAVREITFHEGRIEGGAMQLTNIPGGFNLSAHGEIVMRPDSSQILLKGLTGALKPGDKLPVTLVFLQAGELEMEVPVLKANAKIPPIKHQAHKP